MGALSRKEDWAIGGEDEVVDDGVCEFVDNSYTSYTS
jgi:hypothetical protein